MDVVYPKIRSLESESNVSDYIYPADNMAASLEIPLIHLRPFLDDSASHASRNAVVDQVRNACMTYGFFQLEGHGIPLNLQEKMIECAKLFFDLPLEKKTAVGMDKAMGKSSRGYEVIGGQILQPDTLPDLKEVNYTLNYFES
jgi:isopenicillin N synthase-like dioxygenase